MSKTIVTAAEGVRLKVTVQKRHVVTQNVPEVRGPSNELLAPATSNTFETFADKSIVTFASEAREFDIGADERLIVENQA